jgi:hypothetical protein
MTRPASMVDIGSREAVRLLEELRERLDAEQVAVTFAVPDTGPVTLSVHRGGLCSIENPYGATTFQAG